MSTLVRAAGGAVTTLAMAAQPSAGCFPVQSDPSPSSGPDEPLDKLKFLSEGQDTHIDASNAEGFKLEDINPPVTVSSLSALVNGFLGHQHCAPLVVQPGLCKQIRIQLWRKFRQALRDKKGLFLQVRLSTSTALCSWLSFCLWPLLAGRSSLAPFLYPYHSASCRWCLWPSVPFSAR